MLSKEEIERKLEQTEDDETTINLLYLKIDLLESDKQKLKEKLEKESKELKHDILTMSIDTGNNYSLKLIHEAEGMKKQNDRILSILKGENHE